jgi:ferredoxin--NADP+ reductase
MLGDNGILTGLEVEDNILVLKDGQLKARGTGHKRVLPLDTVIFAIGDKVDASVGLPVASNEFIKNPAPRFPVDHLSYEAFDPASQAAIPDIFVGGWSRQASDGLVGIARKDGINAARAVEQYLQTLPAMRPDLDEVAKKMKSLSKPIITKDELHKLEAIETAEAQKRGQEEFKFASNEEMLQALGLEEVSLDSAD